MKKTIMVVLCSFFCLTILHAQDSLRIVRTNPQLDDIFRLLESMDVHVFRFDLRRFCKENYEVLTYVDEYKKGKFSERYVHNHMGANIRSLNDIPEVHREHVRQKEQVPDGKNEWVDINDLSIFIKNVNDSTAVVTFSIPEVCTMGNLLKLKKVGSSNYCYYTRPFKSQAISAEGRLSIPLVLYGSAWADKNSPDLYRFCGESEIDPQMQAEILNHSPHYYVIGVEFIPLGHKSDIPME